jgi:UDP-3-O-[3-hydroxymyristoyl] glucosamine N-acyltransferase
LKAAFEGAGDLDITGAAPLESAGPRRPRFRRQSQSGRQADQSRAGCLLVPDEFPGRPHADPRWRSPRRLRQRDRLLYPPPPITPGIHPTAVIAPDAEDRQPPPSARTRPSAPAPHRRAHRYRRRLHHRRGVASARIACCTRVTIYDTSASAIAPCCTPAACSAPTASDSCAARNGYEKFPQIGRVEIGDDVEIGANSCVDRAALGVTSHRRRRQARQPGAHRHNCSIGRHVVIAAQTGLSAEWWWKITP